MEGLRIFEAHGVIFSGQAGDQAYGRCPFSGKDNKFYVNVKSRCWDSKTAGVSGNASKFLDLIAIQYEHALTPELTAALAEDRGLPVDAFTGWGIGWTGTAYSIPVRNYDGRCTDIRLYRLGKRILSTAGASVGLLGADMMADDTSAPIYLCEGEWDAIAARYSMHLGTAHHGIVLAVPGAATFKQEWAPWFLTRHVHCLYDNDDAGADGELTAYRRLGIPTDAITFIRWPEVCPTGWDVRDWVMSTLGTPGVRQGWTKLHQLFIPKPRRMLTPDGKPIDVPPSNASSAPKDTTGGNGHRPTQWKTPPTYPDVVSVFKKWLFLDNTDAIRVMLATHISQTLDGPPVWLFLVGPPGSAKTETLSTLEQIPAIYTTSSLTAPSLISGAVWKDNGDPSLIPRLNGRTLVIKDFTSILAMRDAEKNEVFGILRDAYDGRCGKEFGNGVVRKYESRFTVLAAVTPSIYALSSQHTALGERFLKFATGDNLIHVSETEVINRAIDNINKETAMRAEMQDVVLQFIMRRIDLPALKDHPPTIPPTIKARIVNLARFGARMRGTVSRDQFRNEIIISRPSAEVGSRLGIQLAKLAKSLAAVEGRPATNLDDYRILKKVVLDTIPQRTEDLIRFMVKACPTPMDYITAHDLAQMTRYPIMTVTRVLQDLTVLDVTTRTGTTYKHHWGLSEYIRGCLSAAQLYRTEEELSRTSHAGMRCRVRSRVRGTIKTPAPTP